MFTFIIQFIDLAKAHEIGLFFVFFSASWAVFALKILVMIRRKPLQGINTGGRDFTGNVSVVIPIVDEPVDVWSATLMDLKAALALVDVAEVIVVANGSNAKENVRIAKKMGFKVVREPVASKRRAIWRGAMMATGDVTIILDSDTKVERESIKRLIRVFNDPEVGGATPRHVIWGRHANIMRRISNWLEDIRFEEVVSGQSSFGSVACLPGRMLAIRTGILRSFCPALVHQRFMGAECISGDDRFLTSEILRIGMKTVFVPDAVVYTEAPDTLRVFIQQRLRWSRTSFRESIRALRWTRFYMWMSFTTYSTIILRWFFFVVAVTAVLAWMGVIERHHAVNLPLWVIVVGTVAGFFVSGLLRQLRHLFKNPEDLKYLPAFLFVTTFILTPVEWWGNITMRESHWMTRNTKGGE